MKDRKWEAVQVGLFISALGAVILGVFWLSLERRDMEEDRNYYRALYEIEAETTQTLLDSTMARMRGDTTGVKMIDIEIPCTVDQGVVHRLEFKVVK